MGPMDLTNYVKTYEKAFRVCYTAIKSTNANDRVYLSLSYNWMNEMDGQLKYGGKEIIDSFNSIANNQGQMEWGLAYHHIHVRLIRILYFGMTPRQQDWLKMTLIHRSSTLPT